LVTAVIYVDFQNAFDTVSHSKLLSKMSAHNITDDILGWIRSFLYVTELSKLKLKIPFHVQF